MKKIVVLLLVSSLALLASCGETKETNVEAPIVEAPATEEEATEEEATEEEATEEEATEETAG